MSNTTACKEDLIRKLALKYFDQAGFCEASEPSTLHYYRQWLDEGLHGEMSYLVRHLDKKAQPQLLLPGAKSWLALTLNYDTQEPLSIELQEECRRDKKGWIARYARGKDYHQEITARHENLIVELKKYFPEHSFLSCVDTKAVLERDVAARAGLGWVGKNNCLINKDQGSFIFLSEILTTLEVISDLPVMDHCGTCTRCLDACPTQALIEPRKLDANKCISYWTIESKSSAPPALAAKFGANIFGCDICQDVCPWNKKSRRHKYQNSFFLESGGSNLGESGFVPLFDLCSKKEDDIKLMLHNKSLNRVKPNKFRENAVQALTNLSKEPL